MKFDLYQVDAFTSKVFAGNPAAVVPLDSWIAQEKMQAIAMENNLAETAFFVPCSDYYEIRWFTPTIEVELCGHATLASAHVLFQHLGVQDEVIVFKTQRRGSLTVQKEGELINMDFPADLCIDQAEDMQEVISKILGHPIIGCIRGSDDFLVEVEHEDMVRSLSPDFDQISKLKSRGLLVTAKSKNYDFVSRCFFPQSGIDEDPVTGSAHTLLTPYWAAKLGKKKLVGRQVSSRGGVVSCQLAGERVILGGSAITYLFGKIIIPDGIS